MLGDKSYQAANLQQAYVSNSRFSYTQTLFTTNKERAFDSMANFEKRPLANELMKIPASSPFKRQENKIMPTKEEEEVVVNPKPAGSLDWTPAEGRIGINA